MLNININTFKTKDLTKDKIFLICKIKNSHWVWTVSKQINWFKKNVKKMDINNLLSVNNKLVAYNLLRKRKVLQGQKLFNYYYFDTIIILKKWRKKGLGETLMKHNNKIIDKSKKHAFLICQKRNVEFYKKYRWKVIPNNKFELMDHKPTWFNKKDDLIGMVYGLTNNKKKLFYYLKK